MFREVHRLHKVLLNEMEKCDQDDIERQKVLDEVNRKCDALKAAFEISEGAVIQLQKQKETHKQVWLYFAIGTFDLLINPHSYDSIREFGCVFIHFVG